MSELRVCRLASELSVKSTHILKLLQLAGHSHNDHNDVLTPTEATNVRNALREEQQGFLASRKAGQLLSVFVQSLKDRNAYLKITGSVGLFPMPAQVIASTGSKVSLEEGHSYRLRIVQTGAEGGKIGIEVDSEINTGVTRKIAKPPKSGSEPTPGDSSAKPTPSRDSPQRKAATDKRAKATVGDDHDSRVTAPQKVAVKRPSAAERLKQIYRNRLKTRLNTGRSEIIEYLGKLKLDPDLKGPTQQVHKASKNRLIPKRIASLMSLYIAFRNEVEYEDYECSDPEKDFLEVAELEIMRYIEECS